MERRGFVEGEAIEKLLVDNFQANAFNGGEGYDDLNDIEDARAIYSIGNWHLPL
jgi:hypothetical protein